MASPMTRAAACTARPLTCSPRISTSPRCRPIRTRRPSFATPSRMATAQRTALAGRSKTAKNASPAVLTSRPRCRASSWRTADRYLSRSSRHGSSPMSTMAWVDSTMSVNSSASRLRAGSTRSTIGCSHRRTGPKASPAPRPRTAATRSERSPTTDTTARWAKRFATPNTTSSTALTAEYRTVRFSSRSRS